MAFKQILGNQRFTTSSDALVTSIFLAFRGANALRSRSFTARLSDFNSQLVPLFIFSIRCKLCAHSAWDQHVPLCFGLELADFLSRSRRSLILIHLIVNLPCTQSGLLHFVFFRSLSFSPRFKHSFKPAGIDWPVAEEIFPPAGMLDAKCFSCKPSVVWTGGKVPRAKRDNSMKVCQEKALIN